MATTIKHDETTVDLAERDRNTDPLSGQPGAHPVSVGVGAAAGGAAAGMAAGAVAGPVGAAVGAVVGAVAGGLGGKAVGEAIDPTEEEAYWRDNYRSRTYVAADEPFETYQPAYRYGVANADVHHARPYSEVEGELKKGWDKVAGTGRMTWDKASLAVRDAYDRACRPRG